MFSLQIFESTHRGCSKNYCVLETSTIYVPSSGTCVLIHFSFVNTSSTLINLLPILQRISLLPATTDNKPISIDFSDDITVLFLDGQLVANLTYFQRVNQLLLIITNNYVLHIVKSTVFTLSDEMTKITRQSSWWRLCTLNNRRIRPIHWIFTKFHPHRYTITYRTYLYIEIMSCPSIG